MLGEGEWICLNNHYSLLSPPLIFKESFHTRGLVRCAVIISLTSWFALSSATIRTANLAVALRNAAVRNDFMCAVGVSPDRILVTEIIGAKITIVADILCEIDGGA